MPKKISQQFHPAVGTHIIADLFGCKNINDNEAVKSIISQSAVVSKATVLSEQFHEFEPQGLTGYILLAESHISIHTWPEVGYAAVDVFTCGDTIQPQKAINYIIEKLVPNSQNLRVLTRSNTPFVS
ncbi:MAG: hypothetical protein RIQ54_237 [Candidatus Parcubacteria bacterium]|jgi:S-adenosylmethionine decarboxylase